MPVDFVRDVVGSVAGTCEERDVLASACRFQRYSYESSRLTRWFCVKPIAAAMFILRCGPKDHVLLMPESSQRINS